MRRPRFVAAVSRLFLTLTLALAAVLLAAGAGTVQAQTTISTTLLWTAPGDDGTIGRAARYDIRYSSNSISGTDTLGWWNGASVVNTTGKVPPNPGAADSVAITGLTAGTRYYAIIKTGDEIPNWSGYSNVAILNPADALAPARISDLRVR